MSDYNSRLQSAVNCFRDMIDEFVAVDSMNIWQDFLENVNGKYVTDRDNIFVTPCDILSGLGIDKDYFLGVHLMIISRESSIAIISHLLIQPHFTIPDIYDGEFTLPTLLTALGLTSQENPLITSKPKMPQMKKAL
jgi:hypothetical protein